LHLAGQEMQLFLTEGAQFLHGRLRAAGVGGDQIIGKELIQPLLFGQAVEQAAKLQEQVRIRFAHGREDCGIAVLRCDLQLAGDMVAHNLAQVGEAVFLVGEYHVVAQARGHGYFLNVFDGAQPVQ